MTVYLVHHGEKQRVPADPALTEVGHQHAAATGAWAREVGIRAVISSPALRTRQTACYLAEASGLLVEIDERARERMEWDGSLPIEAFVALWERASRDRNFVPAGLGDSSHAAAQRLWSLVIEAASRPGPVAIVTHGGVTVDLLRTVLGDGSVPQELIDAGTPSCAITTIDGTSIVCLASVDHLGAWVGNEQAEERLLVG